MSFSQLHINIAYPCELKERGPESFFRAMSTLSLYLDIEAGRESFPQSAPLDRLNSLIRGDEVYEDEQNESTDDPTEIAVIQLPPLARREKDPPEGLPISSFQKRVSQIVGRGSICENCRAAAVRPDRFGCWSYMRLPLSGEAVEFLLRIWQTGIAHTGKSRLNRRFDSLNLKADSQADHFEEGSNSATVFTLNGAQHRIDLRQFLAYLTEAEELDFQAIAEILADFGAVHWPQLRSISKTLAAYSKAREADIPLAERPEHPAPSLGPAPMLLQPSAGDTPDILAWKSFFQLCYWALNLAAPLQLRLIRTD